MTTLADITRKLTILHETPGAQTAAAQIRAVATATKEGAVAIADYARSSLNLDAAMQKGIARAQEAQRAATGYATSLIAAAKANQGLAEKAGLDVLQAGARVAGSSMVGLASTIASLSPVAVGAAGVFTRNVAPALGIVAKEALNVAGAVSRELVPSVGKIGAALAPVALPIIGFLAVIAAIHETVKGAHEAIDAFKELQDYQVKLQSLLSITGGAAGKSADQIEQIAQSIGDLKNTREAATELVKLRAALPGDAFEQTLKTAKDLNALGFGSMKDAAKTLAGALSDPKKALEDLEKGGLRFTVAQKEQLQVLVQSGKEAQAYGLFLEMVGSQVGGASSAVADTLTGAYGKLSDALKISSEQLGVQLVVFGHLESIVRALASALETLNNLEVPAAFSILTGVLIPGGGAGNAGKYVPNPKGVPLTNPDKSMLSPDAQSQLQQEFENQQRFQGKLKSMQDENYGLTASDIADKSKEEIKAIVDARKKQKEFDDILKEAHLYGVGSDDPRVKGLRDQYDLSKRLADTKEDKDDKPDRYDVVARQLERQNARTSADILSVGQPTSTQQQLRDEFALLEAAKEADKGVTDKQIAAYAELRGSMTATQAMVAAGIKLGKDEATTFLRVTEAARASGEAKEKAAFASKLSYDQQTALLSPESIQIAGQLKSIYGNDVAKALASSEAAALRTVDALKQINQVGGQAFSGFVLDIAHGVNGMTALQNALKKLTDSLLDVASKKLWEAALGGVGSSGLLGLVGLPTTGAKLFHSGGIVGIDGTDRYVHPDYFDNAPRFHSGLMPDEFPAILQRGEGVFTKAQMSSLGNGASFGDTHIVINGNADAGTVEQLRQELATHRAALVQQQKSATSGAHQQRTGVMRAQ